MRRKHAATCCIVALAVVLVGSIGRAQTPEVPAAPAAPASPVSPAVPAPAETPAFPYTGVVNADLVNVRCGPALYYYALTTVAKGTPVVVEREVRGWLGVRPMEGLFGLVRRGEVALAEDGTAATVSAARARVYASGPSADRQWCVMNMLETGKTVRLAGPADGDMLRVAPPEGSLVYIVRDLVTPTAGEPVPEEGPVGPIHEIDVQPLGADPQRQAFKETDAALKDELAKPISERNYAPFVAAFTDIAEATDKAFLKEAAAQRIAYIDGLRRQQNEYLNVVAIGERLDRRLSEIEAQRIAAATQLQRERAMQRPDFTATGVVAPLLSLEGVDYPIKHKLIDERGRPVVVLASESYDLDNYVGKAVGVRGTKTFQAEWRIYLVNVDDLEVLE